MSNEPTWQKSRNNFAQSLEKSLVKSCRRVTVAKITLFGDVLSIIRWEKTLFTKKVKSFKKFS
jgi:hypothetical protein